MAASFGEADCIRIQPSLFDHAGARSAEASAGRAFT
jgi:hypothetical protein